MLMSWLSENADEVAALGLVFTGLYLCAIGKVDVGFSLITLGTGYLFGKNPPKRRSVVKVTGGIPVV